MATSSAAFLQLFQSCANKKELVKITLALSAVALRMEIVASVTTGTWFCATKILTTIELSNPTFGTVTAQAQITDVVFTFSKNQPPRVSAPSKLVTGNIPIATATNLFGFAGLMTAMAKRKSGRNTGMAPTGRRE